MNIEKIKEMYLEEKKTLSEIGEHFGVDRNTVRYHLKKNSIPIRTRKEVGNLKKIIDVSTIMYLIEECGLLVSDISSIYGVHRYTIHKELKRNGINLKNHKNQRLKQSEFMKENNPIKKGTKRTQEDIEKMKIGMEKSFQRKLKDYMPTTFDEYSRIARYVAYREFNLKTPKGFEIDHIFSIKDGFDNKVPLNVISDKQNLRLITIKENKNKHSNSLMTLEELYSRVGIQRLAIMA